MTAINAQGCAHCGTPIRAGRRSDARYCDTQCKNAARSDTSSTRPAIPTDRPPFRLRSAAELVTGAQALVAAYERRDRGAVLAMEAQLLEGEVSDMLAALVQLVRHARSTSSQVFPT